MAQVWTVGFDEGYKVTLSADFPDGDLRKTEYVDRTKDVLSVGFDFPAGDKRLGRALKPNNIPTKFRWGGSAERMPDLMLSHSVMLASDKVKDIIEGLEPGVHQFFPLETWAKGNTPARRMYLMNICNRLDSVDRKKTTKPMRDQHSWRNGKPGELVFSLAQIGGHKLWHDKHIFDNMYFIDDVKNAFEAASVSGVKYFGYRAE
ncbi:imm11 family protein [Tabrizicola sp.]|uniref:imm11 family protein n=1 Tax=Tabrizicola sp. TaxID=2005166 RepID=UPI002FDDC130